MIMKYINMDLNEHYTRIDSKLDQNAEYKQSEKDFYNLIKPLDENFGFEIESKTNFMEALAKDVSYDTGFSDGVRFILGCINTSKE